MGVWFIGALGSIATTVIAGAAVMSRGLHPAIGMVSDSPLCDGLGLVPIKRLVFGGHEIRPGTIAKAVAATSRENGSIQAEWVRSIGSDLARVDRNIRPGVSAGAGGAIESLATGLRNRKAEPAATAIARLAEDIRQFTSKVGAARTIVVNVSSTEPPASDELKTSTLPAMRRELARRPAAEFRPGLLYALSAVAAGAAFVNFTASGSCLVPAVEAAARERGLPYFGNDGKTGETLVKSALAPMFRMRQLQVLSWVGFNVLGNQDGLILSDDANKRSKVATKDGVIGSILGYAPTTRVGIEYVPSIGDQKTAWDLIHFAGFLGHRMSMQFTWSGCDSILAAPLILDLVRFADLAMRRGESGPMSHLSSFFKGPIDATTADLHQQFEQLRNYCDRARKVRNVR